MNSPMNMMVAILISIFGLVSASFDYDGRPTLEDVQKFYRSRENIYVLRRSFKLEDESGDSPKCIWNKRVDGDVFKLQEAYVVGLTVKKWSSVIHFSILRPTATMCCRNLLRRSHKVSTPLLGKKRFFDTAETTCQGNRFPRFTFRILEL
ncbi:uncharacterized protein LOC142796415 isoform X5 [Rhipicephalus microplus]|uniref:uncharacterized protein LOC142796415 isoform X5 n=1 Tax=Rhipicephalus microplus TaxID=6941 RepID=UPI003F6B21B2